MNAYFMLWLSMLGSTFAVIGVLLHLTPDDLDGWWVSLVATAWGVVLVATLLMAFQHV